MLKNRIVSFLPSATEIIYELGLEDLLYGVTHQCVFPSDASLKPMIIKSTFNSDILSSKEIDQKVIEITNQQKNMFILDSNLLLVANPNLIISQGICDVCSPYTNELTEALRILPNKPDLLVLSPNTLYDILENIVEIASRIGNIEKALGLKKSLLNRIRKVSKVSSRSTMPKVICLEWADPLYIAGHWIPQLVEIAGGINGISKPGQRSTPIKFSEIVEFDPDVVFLMPCGFDLNRTIKESKILRDIYDWESVRAFKHNRIYAVDALAYFSRPGPKVVAGLEILAKIIHPELFTDFEIPEKSFSII